MAVDAPHATGPLGYVRFHGRNAATGEARAASASDRFDYLYSADELAEWRAPIERLSAQTERTWVMFNNCRYDYAPRNAVQMATLLGDVMAPRLDGGDEPEPEPGIGEQMGLEL